MTSARQDSTDRIATSESIGPAELRINRLYPLLAILLAGAICCGAWLYYRYLYQRSLSALHQSLTAVATLKAQALQGWMRDRRGDIIVASQSLAARWKLAQPDSPEANKAFEGRLKHFVEAFGYFAVVLTDSEGKVLRAAPEAAPLPTASLAVQIQTALRSGEVLVTDLRRISPDEPEYLWLSSPVFRGVENDGSPIGAALLLMDPRNRIYPEVARWPIPSRTARASLVAVDGDHAIILDRQGSPSSGAMAPALSGGDLQALLAGRPAEISTPEGVVIATMQKVPGTPWHVLTQMDREEFVGSLRSEAWNIVVIAALSVIVSSLGLLLLRRQQNLDYTRRELDERRAAAEALRASEQRFRLLFENAPIAASITRGRESLAANRRVAPLFGYERAEEFLALPLEEKLAPESMAFLQDNNRRREPSAPEPTEIELIGRRKDGSFFPLLLLVAGVELPDGPALLVLHQDLTERKRAEEHVRRLNRVYAVLSGINGLIVRERNPQRLFETACTIAVEAGKFRMAWVGMVDETTQSLKPVASAGHGDGYLEEYVNDPLRRTRPSNKALFTGQHQVVNNLTEDPAGQAWRDGLIRRGYRAGASFPLKVAGRTVGAFTFFASEPDFFDYDEIRLLDELATDVGFALEVCQQESSRLASKARLSRQRDALIHLGADPGSREGDFTATMRQITEELSRTLAVGRVSIWHFNADRTSLKCLCQFEAALARHDAGQELSGAACRGYFQAMTMGEVLAVSDVHADARTCEMAESYLLPNRIGALLDAPIHVGGKITGVLCHEHLSTTREWTSDEKTFAVAMANLVSLSIERWERRQAESALRASEDQFRDVAGAIKDVFWIYDAKARQIVYVSPAFTSVWGTSWPNLPENQKVWLDSVHPDDRERVRHNSTTRQASGDYNEEYRIIRPDGAERWIHDSAYPVQSKDGTVERIVGVARDITEHRALEAQLRQSQKMEAIGQLAGGVAHDFNNILGAIMMQAELAEKEEVTEGTREWLREICLAAERAATLTRQLLMFSRRQVMQTRQLDLNEVVSGLTKMLQRIIGEDVRMQLSLHPTALLTTADAGMLDQVLMNLAVNSRDAMPNGGRLVIETSARKLPENVTRLHPDADPGEYVVLSVSDTGMGIPPEVLPRIFEPFFTTKEPGKGTGLGLATVFGIVRQHRGWIDVSSTLSEGTTFEIFLPAATQGLLSGPVEAPRTRPSGGHETVLLVEDDLLIRVATRALLDRNGYRVLEASNGAEALDVWATHRGQIALVLTDMVMPGGFTGQELAQRLREEAPELKVIFISGYSAAIAGHALELRPGDDFIQKPCPPDQMLQVIRRSLDGPGAAPAATALVEAS